MTGRYGIIAGGGTAGHVVPALAIGRALVERGHPAESLHFVGSERGIESRLVPEAGFSVTLLPGRGIQRRLTAENIPAAAGLAKGLARSATLLRRERPQVVVAVGGYASLACALAAEALRIPVVVQEQNAVPGAANRIVARFARASAIAYPGTPLPRATLTGNPVRPEVSAIDRVADRERARSELGLPPDRRVLAVFGGSLGSLRINQAVLEAVARWDGRADIAVYHVTGERDWDTIHRAAPPGAAPPFYTAVRYEDRMPLLYAAADLFLCRAGGNTVAELAVVGVPGVLVPLPGAPGDHQTANARALAGAGGAVLVPDAELDGARLVAEAGALLGDAARLEAMGRAAASMGRRDAADRVAALVEMHARA